MKKQTTREFASVAVLIAAAVGERRSRDGVPLVAPHDGLGAVTGGFVGVGQLLEDRQPRRQADFSADGQKVVTASADSTARIWNALTGEPLGEAMKQFKAAFKV